MPTNDDGKGNGPYRPTPIGEMTLRDHFASAVLNGLCANHVAAQSGEFVSRSKTAKYCYEMADAMLLERENGEVK